jgi:hypothetical protein
MEKVGIFCGHLEYITAIWYILCPFGIFYVRLVILLQFGIFFPVLVYCNKTNLATLLAFRALTERDRLWIWTQSYD